MPTDIGSVEMPWYVTAYVLALIAMSAMGFQVARRRGYPTWLLAGDALSGLAAITLVVAYWHERWRLAIGGVAVPLFVFWIAWTVYALKPNLELALTEAAARSGDGPGIEAAAITSTVIMLVVVAPAMLWGLRIVRGILQF